MNHFPTFEKRDGKLSNLSEKELQKRIEALEA
jgi:hypothetical protein